MGAESFRTVGKGQTMHEAFKNAVRQAEYDYGHSGYTGSIAEKDAVVLIDDSGLPDVVAVALAEKLISERDERIDDKWGPAGAIKLMSGDWLFFGIASS